MSDARASRSERIVSSTPKSTARVWHQWSSSIRFYGVLFLAGTKTADALLTAVALLYIPTIVEQNPVADAIFLQVGTLEGLAMLSVATVMLVTIVAELLALSVRYGLRMKRLALTVQLSIYGSLSLLFGAVAIYNALLLSQEIQQYIQDALLVVTTGAA